jgi:cellulose synthase operon protein C
VPGASIPAGSDAQWSQLSAQFRPKRGREEELFHSFARRSAEAGMELLSEVEREPVRAHDRVLLARMLVWLLPGDAEALRRLKQAAEADRDAVFSAALAHIVDGVLGGRTGEFAAPALGRQVEQPQNLRALLFGELVNPSAEALAILWQSAARVLTQHFAPADPGATQPVAEGSSEFADYFQLTRLFGAKRTPLLELRGARGPLTAKVSFAAVPAVLVSGDAPAPSDELSYELGAALAATLPQNVLLYTGSAAREEELFRAISAAFGPPESSASTFVGGARLAELLWKNVPPRAQRRLTELCAQGSLSRSEALKSAQRAAARAGLYATGNLATSLLKLTSPAKAAQLVEPGGLALVCKSDAAAADLLRLATSPQYAEARFRTDRARRGAGFSWRVR